jgi:SAM-dependent methyltransferase
MRAMAVLGCAVVAESPRTTDAAYTRRLERLGGAWWKRLLDVQRPYRWHLRRLRLGFVLDVGCGLGRNLINVGGAGVGVDHSAESVAVARGRGLQAFTPAEFLSSAHASPGRFDALLLSHVVEHMRFAEAVELLSTYLPYLKAGGRVLLIAPQEAGYASDPTHIEFMDLTALDRLARAVTLEPVKAYSFPFPRLAGRLFKYNEFVLLARKP